MRDNQPHLALRAEVDTPERLVERVQDGALDVAVLYSAQRQTSLVVELLAEEKLVMVTTHPDRKYDPENYIHVDWGPDFATNQQNAFPDLANPTMSISLGPLALHYLLAMGGSGYFRLSAVRHSLNEGELYRVPDVPEFSHSIYLVHTGREGAELGSVREGFRTCIQLA